VATGSFQITGYNAANTYTFTPSVVSISGTGLVTANAGTYTFTVTNASGCTSTASANIVVNPQPTTPTAPTVGAVTQPTCSVATGSFQITGYNAANTYTFTPSVVSISGTGLVTANAGTYTFTLTNASGCTSSASSSLSIDSVPSSPIVSTVSGCNGAIFEITASVDSGMATYEWYDSSSNLIGTTATIAITESGTYEVIATVNSCTTTEFVTVDKSPCVIPKGVSPNNDGLNDTWNLSGLNAKKVQIFNRYGVEVYSKSDYTNEWEGKTNSGDELPSATYYYVVSLPNGEVKTGWVYINREN
ncbi:gliding motility-associated C-terminal domain-containing protein, partial [Flavobacterium proteolyticum]